MNERMDQLIEKADILFAMESVPQTGLRFEVAMVSREDLKNLTELIVRECAGIFKGMYTDSCPGIRIDIEIKKHFGVEK